MRTKRPTERTLMIWTADGKVYAVELRDGWIPTLALGPFANDQLPADPAALDWSAAQDASTWNLADLVRLCCRERERLACGKSRSSTAAEVSGLKALVDRNVTQVPDFLMVKTAADQAKSSQS